MTQNARIVSLQVGTPAQHGTPGAADPLKRPWHSGFAKKPVQTPVQLERTNFVGDGQADLEHHGGPEKAVCVYPAAHFPYWSERLGKPFGPGAFGENLSVSGLVEENVCVGDVFRIGNSLVQVSQPRSPCWKLARFHGEKHLALWVQETGFCGWYFSVVETGQVQAGDHLELVERPFPQWTVAETHAVRYHRKDDLEAARALAACPALSSTWSEALAKRAAKAEQGDDSPRLLGPNQDDG